MEFKPLVDLENNLCRQCKYCREVPYSFAIYCVKLKRWVKPRKTCKEYREK